MAKVNIPFQNSKSSYEISRNAATVAYEELTEKYSIYQVIDALINFNYLTRNDTVCHLLYEFNHVKKQIKAGKTKPFGLFRAKEELAIIRGLENAIVRFHDEPQEGEIPVIIAVKRMYLTYFLLSNGLTVKDYQRAFSFTDETL